MNKAAAIPAVLAAGIALAPLAHANGTQASLESAVRTLYNDVQARCTPSLTPHFQGISYDKGSYAGGVGQGRIIDADPRLGGPFDYMWGPPGSVGVPSATYRRVPAQPDGDWYINFEFC